MTLVLSPLEIVKKREEAGRLGLLSKHESWSRVPLKELCSIQNGAPFESSRFNNMGLGVPLIRIRDVGKNTTETWFSGEFDEGFIVHPGDLLIGMDGDFRLSKWLGSEGLLNQRVCRLKVTSIEVNKVFLELVVPGYLDAIWQETSATTVKHLSSRSIGDIPIPLPPLDEQEKIVEILEEQFSRLDAALASVRAVREKSERFRRSLLNSIFENQFRKYGDSSIEEMLEVLPSGRKLDQGWSPQCLRQPVENNEDWGVLITTAVQHGSFNWKENKLLPATMAPRPAIELKNGDFLMTRLGPRPRCGVACMVRDTRSQLMVPDKMYRFRPNQLFLEANFLNIYITSPQFLDAIEVLKTGTSESGMNITQSRFLAVKVPRTPVGEQIEIASDIAAQLSRLEASLAIADEIEKKASALRRSLLHAAFTGNLIKEWREGAHV